MVCAEGAAEGLADVGGTEGRGEVEDRAEDEGVGVGIVGVFIVVVVVAVVWG